MANVQQSHVKPVIYCEKTGLLGDDPSQKKMKIDYRLPEGVKPVHYDLLLTPDLKTGKFSGHVGIDVQVKAKRNDLVLHGKDLRISSFRVLDSKGDELPLASKNMEMDSVRDFYIIRAKNGFSSGNYKVEIDYEGSLTDRITGFYQSTYTDEHGDKRCKYLRMSVPEVKIEPQEFSIKDIEFEIKEEIECELCNESFTGQHDLEQHMLEHYHSCTFCSDTFPDSSALEIHLKIHADVKPFVCTICNEAFAVKLDFDQHVCNGEKTLTLSESESLLCKICGRTYKFMSEMKKHMLTHSEERPHKCELCNKAFKEVRILKTHKLIHSGVRPHKCDLCDETFTLPHNLNRHMLVHTGERPHACAVCDKKFTQAGSLKTHMLIHSGKRPHKCTVCEKTFNHVGTLNKHKLLHSRERLHKCEVCSKKFTLTSDLNRHMLIHGKVHECETCNKTFTQKRLLNQHKLVHAEEIMHKCIMCDKAFTLKSQLKQHMLIHSGAGSHKCT
ncbi:zinc finger protein 714-like [Ctenocephalides felis]|uniref:zinc finger protein 714-like n=1 Tax=Ctenocephalides felis TaxID=7515 RepID=UPI000E6E3D89|nr:zinc finger protein 714-like [Ctenocephalides felis]